MNTVIRYSVEHEALPNAFYNDGIQLMYSVLCKSGHVVKSFFDKAVLSNSGYTCPYDDSDFSEDYREYILDDGAVLILRLGMPKPEVSPLCRAAYLCYGRDGLGDFFITSELGSSSKYVLCGWADNHMHLYISEAPEDEYDRVAEIYQELIIDGGLKQLKSVCTGKRRV